MRALEVNSMMIETAVLLLVSVSMLIYLVFALLRPEKF
jgi:K+-transporting ATPase KdpF subunit